MEVEGIRRGSDAKQDMLKSLRRYEKVQVYPKWMQRLRTSGKKLTEQLAYKVQLENGYYTGVGVFQVIQL